MGTAGDRAARRPRVASTPGWLGHVQAGQIGQMEFAKLGTVGSDGALDYATPYADDDGRDHEIHRRGHFGPELAVQTKIAMSLHLNNGAREFGARIDFKAGRPVRSSPIYWYFFCYIDPRSMRVEGPCFLVPSAVVHRLGARLNRGRLTEIVFKASMEPGSHDRWVRYRVPAAEVGRRLLAIIRALDARRLAAGAALDPGDFEHAVLIRRRRR
ncbi:MAG TPA: hypothetical protein VET26_02680 [Candidatus Sulfotelmatobacter sp.]|nr:hypothetical protein [Candidatus Sulfotelmatobacter sp.]